MNQKCTDLSTFICIPTQARAKTVSFEKGKRKSGRESNSKAMRLSNDTHDHIIFLVAMPLPTHILLKIFSP